MRLRHVFVLRAILTASAATAPSGRRSLRAPRPSTPRVPRWRPERPGDHHSRCARKTIENAVAGLSAEERSGFELHMIAGGRLTTFDWLPSEEQKEIVDVVVPFVTSLLETAE